MITVAEVQPPLAISPPGVIFDRLPLVIGVTGHRDVVAEDEAPLRAAFGKILEDLALAHPHTPLLVLSGIAAGADTLAAEEAISRGIPVLACLPLAVDDYETDFSEEERRRFREVLSQCARVTRVSKAVKREAAYVGVGSYIIHYSHVLVAFWDGGEPGGAGGTADIVYSRTTGLQMQRDGDCPVADQPNIGPVFRIVTPRLSGERPANPYWIHRNYPRRFFKDPNAERDFIASLKRLDLYNADISRGDAQLKGESSLRTFMERTDSAANRLQSRALFFLRLLYIFGFIAAGSQVGFSVEWIRLTTLGMGLVAYYLAQKNDYENRYQDYRTLGEGLRVQTAWHAAGLSGELVETCYLKMQESELQWIRMALRTMYLLYCEEGTKHPPSHEHPDCRGWIRGQWRFYHKAARREARRENRFALQGKVAVIGGLALAGLTSLVLYTPLHDLALLAPFLKQFNEPLKILSSASIAMGLLIAALLSSYAEKRDFGANVKRYDRMFHVFDRAWRRLNSIKRGFDEDPRGIVRDLGREALIEHADWLLARRDRPLTLVR